MRGEVSGRSTPDAPRTGGLPATLVSRRPKAQSRAVVSGPDLVPRTRTKGRPETDPCAPWPWTTSDEGERGRDVVPSSA